MALAQGMAEKFRGLDIRNTASSKVEPEVLHRIDQVRDSYTLTLKFGQEDTVPPETFVYVLKAMFPFVLVQCSGPLS